MLTRLVVTACVLGACSDSAESIDASSTTEDFDSAPPRDTGSPVDTESPIDARDTAEGLACPVCPLGWCSFGICQEPEVLAQQEFRPGAVLVVGDRVFWSSGASSGEASDGGIRTSLIDGSGATWLVQGIAIVDMVTDGQRIYWSNRKTIESIKIDGTGRKTLVTDGAAIDRIVIADDSIFWIDSALGQVMTVFRSGAGESVFAETTAPSSLAVMPPYLIVSEVDKHAGRIVALQGPLVLAENQEWPTGLAVVGGQVYWTNRTENGDASVMRTSLDGPVETVLVPRRGAIGNLGVCGDWLAMSSTFDEGGPKFSGLAADGHLVEFASMAVGEFSCAEGFAYFAAKDSKIFRLRIPPSDP